MSTKTKFIFLMSFLALVIVGCVASMVIVLAAPKQKGFLDVSIKYVGGLHKEREMFNGRYYYYYEMGEYPQTYAGAATSVTGLTETQEKFVCDMSTPTSTTETTIEENKEYNIWTDESGSKYIKHIVNPRNTNEHFFYVNGTTPIKGEEAFFLIEPIKWDIVGYYNNDKSDFTRVTDADFSPVHSTNLVVTSRTALQSMPWYPNSRTTDVDYLESYVYTWLRTFEDSVLAKFKDTKIQSVTNQYMDSSANASYAGTIMAGNVKEYAWIMDYNQSSTMFSSAIERITSPSDFALATYSYLNISYQSITRTGSSYSWLRSSYLSGSDYFAGCVTVEGEIGRTYIYYPDFSVRPCMLINL